MTRLPVTRRYVVRIALALLSVSSALPTIAAQRPAAVAKPAATNPDAAFTEKTKSAARRDGLLVTWLDRKAGKLWLELPPPVGPYQECGEYLYVEGIRTGLGSNPVGLDRGQLGETRVTVFRRVGGRVLLEQRNLRYRAQSEDAEEQRAVRESFASSVLWGGEIAAEAGDGRLLVDFTPFLVRDAHGVVARLKSAKQGSYSLDKDRSALDPENSPAFPDNVEFEAVLTFTGDEPGPEVRETAPTPQAVTIVQHQSFVRLPDAGYTPRAWDPRSGSFDVLFADYAQPIGADIDRRWLVRHRLEKTDPAAARSRVKEPIVYYVDPGAPEPIRSALIEGASWWAQAFDAAGFIDAFQVRLLPKDASPLDARYNVIQWVHRATRGWSYGGGVVDPRTGEMIKGHVTLGSLRVRQDRMIFEALAGAEKTGSGAADDPVQLSLARIRQLAAHEVGHTLGFAHNFAASTYPVRGSVMDYPAPLIRLHSNGELNFADAYATGIGRWDIQQVRYAYTQFAPGVDEKAGLEAILAENRARGYLYMSDIDTRPAGAAHPKAAMWDNGEEPVSQLVHEMAVRRAALARFGEHNIAAGTPLATLSEVLAPLYFYHRYALTACAKSLGGLDYAYSVRGDGSAPATPVPAGRQRAALAALVATLKPAELDLPEPLLGLLPPPAMDLPPHRETFGSRTRPAFDALGAAAAATELVLAELLPPERLARLVDFHRRDPSYPGVEEVLDALVAEVFASATEPPRLREIRRTMAATTVRRLMAAASLPAQTPAVRAALETTLDRLRTRIATAGGNAADKALATMLAQDIKRWRNRPATAAPAPDAAPGAALEPPPGPPIGAWDDEDEWSASYRTGN